MIWLSDEAIEYAVCRCRKIPRYKVGIALNTRTKSNDVHSCLCRHLRYSDVLRFLKQSDGERVEFYNGSCIQIIPATANSCGYKIHLLIADEDICDETLNSVLRPLEILDKIDKQRRELQNPGMSEKNINNFRKEYTTMNKISIHYHNNNIDKIEKISKGDWIDLRAAETVELKAGDFKIISLGVSMKLPEGYEAHIVPRSSTFKKWGILQTNHMGVIDNSYSGDNDVWGMPVLAMRDTIIKENDRICQFRIVKQMEQVEMEEVEHLEGANRGGFGSTGTN